MPNQGQIQWSIGSFRIETTYGHISDRIRQSQVMRISNLVVANSRLLVDNYNRIQSPSNVFRPLYPNVRPQAGRSSVDLDGP